MLKLKNILKGFEKQVEIAEIKMDEINRNLNQAKEEFKKLFNHDVKLKILLRRQLEINSVPDIDNEDYLLYGADIEVNRNDKNKIDETTGCL